MILWFRQKLMQINHCLLFVCWVLVLMIAHLWYKRHVMYLTLIKHYDLSQQWNLGIIKFLKFSHNKRYWHKLFWRFITCLEKVKSLKNANIKDCPVRLKKEIEIVLILLVLQCFMSCLDILAISFFINCQQS